ncbi:MAG: peptidoglycan-binding protein [Phycisphaerales bacterium]
MDHVVSQGECLSSIAWGYGFPDWKVIYNHSKNAAFKAKRPNPNLIYPGDVIHIPLPDKKDESCATGQRHRFKVTHHPTYLNIRLIDSDDKPIADGKFVLTIDTLTFDGKTDGNGYVKQKIPAWATVGKLTVWPDAKNTEAKHEWQLLIGHLDPLPNLAAVQERLLNLGYDCGPVDGIDGPLTQAGVRAFQTDYNLLVDGIVGPQTGGKLEEVHVV